MKRSPNGFGLRGWPRTGGLALQRLLAWRFPRFAEAAQTFHNVLGIMETIFLPHVNAPAATPVGHLSGNLGRNELRRIEVSNCRNNVI